MYTLENLKEVNQTCRQPITEKVLEQVNLLINFRDSLDYSVPQVGDIVQYEDINGKISKYAHVEKVEDGKLYLCKHPSTPFVGIDLVNNRLSTSTSGGDWTTIFIEDLEIENLGKTKKYFCSFFGNAGASQAVRFQLEVKIWKYREIRSYDESLFESVREKRVHQLLDEVRETRPKDIYEALKILAKAFDWDRCFTLSPMFGEEEKACIKLFNRYEIYCYTDYKHVWSIFDKQKKYVPEKEKVSA